MRKLILIGAIALLAMPATAAFAVPMCDGPTALPDGMKDYGFGKQTEEEAATSFEQELVMKGIPAHQTRFWNNCIQTFVNVDGHDVMKFYDPATLAEIPPN